MVAYIPNNIPYKEPKKNEILEMVGKYYIKLQKNREKTKKILKSSKQKDLTAIEDVVECIHNLESIIKTSETTEKKLLSIQKIVGEYLKKERPSINCCAKIIYEDLKSYLSLIDKNLCREKGSTNAKLIFVRTTLDNYYRVFGKNFEFRR